MPSNIKPKPTAKEAPTEPFKRAVTGCLRAIARQHELEVSFAAEPPGLAGGQAPPPVAARKLVDLWRPWIEDRAGRDLDRLEKFVENQRRFADAVHDLLDSLDMGDDRSRDAEDEDDEGGDQDGREDDASGEGEAKE